MKANIKVTLAAAAIAIAFSTGIAEAEKISRCAAYDVDIDAGVARATLPPVIACSESPTGNPAEFTFTLTLRDGRIAKMTCDPERCTAPFLVGKKAVPTT